MTPQLNSKAFSRKLMSNIVRMLKVCVIVFLTKAKTLKKKQTHKQKQKTKQKPLLTCLGYLALLLIGDTHKKKL